MRRMAGAGRGTASRYGARSTTWSADGISLAPPDALGALLPAAVPFGSTVMPASITTTRITAMRPATVKSRSSGPTGSLGRERMRTDPSVRVEDCPDRTARGKTRTGPSGPRPPGRADGRRASGRPSPRLPGGPDLRDDGWQDRVEVADHGVGRAGDHRRVPVGVDGHDRLGGTRPDHVLDRPADAAGDVQISGDPRPRLADLLGVRSPARRRHDTRHADRPAQQRRQLVELCEPLGTADAAAPTDD